MLAAMAARLMPFLNKLIPAGLAVKGISKLNPKLGAFIQNAVGTGYAAETALDYIRDKMSPSGSTSERNRLEGSSSLTPQEESARGKRRQEGAVGSALGGALGLASGLEGGEEAQAPRQGAQPPPPPRQGPPAPPQEFQKQQALQKFQEKKQKGGGMVADLQNQFQKQHPQWNMKGIQQPQQGQQQQAPSLLEIGMQYYQETQNLDPGKFSKFIQQKTGKGIPYAFASQVMDEVKAELQGGQQQQGQPGQQQPQQGQQQGGGQGQQALMAILQQLQKTRGK